MTSRDGALPGGLKPTEWQWVECLNKKPGKGKPAAEKSIYDAAEWITSEYFLGTGLNFIDEIEAFLSTYSRMNNAVPPPM